MQPAKWQKRHLEYKVAGISTATRSRSAYKHMKDEPTTTAGSSNNLANPKLEVDPSTMSPRTRRRYLSRLSSAKLRDRQRQNLLDVEKDIVLLEDRIEELQQSIDINRLALREDGLLDFSSGHNDEVADSLASVATSGPNHNSRSGGLLHEVEPSATVEIISAPKGRVKADMDLYSLMTSLSNNMDQLAGCVKCIEELKNDICQQVGGLESHVSQLLSSATLQGLHLSAGSDVGNEECSSQNNTLVDDGPPSRRRIPISFLVNNN